MVGPVRLAVQLASLPMQTQFGLADNKLFINIFSLMVFFAAKSIGVFWSGGTMVAVPHAYSLATGTMCGIGPRQDFSYSNSVMGRKPAQSEKAAQSFQFIQLQASHCPSLYWSPTLSLLA